MVPLLSYQIFLFYSIFFVLSERVIFCSLVAVNTLPIASATFCRQRRNLCVAFKGATGEIGSVGGSDGSSFLDDDDGYCNDGRLPPGDSPVLSSSSSSLLQPSLKFFN